MKLDDLKEKEIEINENGFLKVVEKKTGKFIPKDGELYWYVDSCGYVSSEFDYDEWLVNHIPVFAKQKEAEEYKDYLDILDKYKHEFTDEEWKNVNIEKKHLVFHSDNGEIGLFFELTVKCPNCVYFNTNEDAENFVKEAGEANVKRFMFDVWE